MLDCEYVRIREGKGDEPRMIVVEHDGSERPLTDLIAESDIIVNGTYQDTAHPIDFVTEAENLVSNLAA